MIESQTSVALIPMLPVEAQVQHLLEHFRQEWWQSARTIPDLGDVFTSGTQANKEKEFSRLIDGLIYEVKHLSPSAVPAAREATLARLRTHAMAAAHDALRLEEGPLTFLENSGLFEALRSFASMARAFDPSISGADIYQAGRNVMTMNFLQLLMNLPVEVTPAVFAYSMLYPYSDNYLDDAAVSGETKRAFNERFQRRLQGEVVQPVNDHEARISELFAMMEDQYDRARFPQVWESLLAIHNAQMHSLKLVDPHASPYELDVLGITFEKGGTSVLADGYLVAGWLSPQAAAFCFGYGCFTQLMDDLEDMESDRKAGQQTVFTQTLPHWRLDAVTNRVFHFGRRLTALMAAFDSPASGPLQELIEGSLDPMLIQMIGPFSAYYSRAYLQALESHVAFRFAAVNKQRSKLERHKMTLARLVDTLL